MHTHPAWTAPSPRLKGTQPSERGQTPVFDPELVQRYDGQGPRYTSYPTANRFRSDFTATELHAEIAATNSDPIPDRLSLYVHIPYCTSPCFYCGCNRVITRDRDRVAAYAELLNRELLQYTNRFDDDRPLLQLHLGGGTPTSLDGHQLEKLLLTIESMFSLSDSADRDFAIELDPRTVDLQMFGLLRDLGFNRLSFGVQDFDADVQQAINRIQSHELVADVIAAARAEGFKSINVDLIYGLPRQNPTSFAATLEKVVQMAPDRIATYNYAHLPQLFPAQRQIQTGELPPPAVKLELMRESIEVLCAAGYRYVGMDHFARPEDPLSRALDTGSLHRNFNGYSTLSGCDLIGIGASAISAVGGVYAQNAKSVNDYARAINEGRSAVVRGVRLDPDDVIRRDLIETLMCSGALDYAAFGDRHQIDVKAYFATELSGLTRFSDDGLIESHAAGLSVQPRGRLLMRNLAMHFDRYLQEGNQSPAKFSRVV